MADFLVAHRKTSINEGGYANAEHDGGGETFRGIARKKNPLWVGWGAVDGARKQLGLETFGKPETWKQMDAALADNDHLTALVEELYQDKYWVPLHLNDEADQGLADMVYDKAVLMGVGVAKQMYAEAKKHA